MCSGEPLVLLLASHGVDIMRLFYVSQPDMSLIALFDSLHLGRVFVLRVYVYPGR